VTTAACHICRSSPAKTFPIRRHVGMVFMQRFVKLRMPMCRSHNLRYVGDYLGKTLWQGWWGYISFWVNIFVIVADLIVLGLVLAMPKPEPANDLFGWMDRPSTPIAPAPEVPPAPTGDGPQQPGPSPSYGYYG
jgi:hypothetical protein